VIRVALVDDQELVRAGFKMVLDAQPDMTVTGEAADGRAAVELARRGDADVMVMDVRMPGLDGVAAARDICAAGPRPRVLMLTTFDLDEYAFAALKAGASGFLLKDVPPTELLFAIRAVHCGDSVVAPSITRRLLDKFVPLLAGGETGSAHAGPAGAGTGGAGEAGVSAAATCSAAASPEQLAGLTEREREVLLQVAAGLSNAEIAERLFVSEATVKTHVGRILAKLGLRDRVQAVVLAYETGLVRSRADGSSA
jgi:DNA-binding NarL/FixJ family response regulator